MKYTIILALTLCAVCNSWAQSSADNSKILYLLYVDNSKVTDNDGLNDAMTALLSKVTDTVKSKKANFVYFVSDQSNSDMTDNLASIERVNNNLLNHTPRQSIDQKNDIKAIRDMCLDKIAKNDIQNIQIYYFVSSDLCKKVTETYAPLVCFFPEEMLLYNSVKNIKATIVYSKAMSGNTADKLSNAVHFYSKDEFKSNVHYSTIAL